MSITTRIVWHLLFKNLTYSADDRRAGRVNLSKVPLDNCDLYTNLAAGVVAGGRASEPEPRESHRVGQAKSSTTSQNRRGTRLITISPTSAPARLSRLAKG